MDTADPAGKNMCGANWNVKASTSAQLCILLDITPIILKMNVALFHFVSRIYNHERNELRSNLIWSLLFF